jgi:hypothetical protein
VSWLEISHEARRIWRWRLRDLDELLDRWLGGLLDRSQYA